MKVVARSGWLSGLGWEVYYLSLQSTTQPCFRSRDCLEGELSNFLQLLVCQCGFSVAFTGCWLFDTEVVYIFAGRPARNREGLGRHNQAGLNNEFGRSPLLKSVSVESTGMTRNEKQQQQLTWLQCSSLSERRVPPRNWPAVLLWAGGGSFEKPPIGIRLVFA